MTPVEAAHYLADRMKMDRDLRFVISAEAGRAGVTDIFSWAEKHEEQAVALAESWQCMLEQDIPPADWVATP